MKCAKKMMLLCLCGLVLALASCAAPGSGSRDQAKNAGRYAVYTQYTLGNVSDQDAGNTLIFDGWLYMIRWEDNRVCRYSASGAEEVILEPEGERRPVDMEISKEGRLSLLFFGEGENHFCVKEYSSEGELLASRDIVSENRGSEVLEKEGEERFFVRENQLFQVDEQTGKARAEFAFSDLGLDASKIRCMDRLSENAFCFALSCADESLEVVVVSADPLVTGLRTGEETGRTEDEPPRTEPPQDDRQELVYAVQSAYDAQGQVVNFNRSNPDYKITLRAYGIDGLDRMQTDVTTGKADLVGLSGIHEYQTYGKKRCLADIGEYIEASEKIALTDFLDNVVEVCRIDGEIYGIPKQMHFGTLLIPAQYASGKTDWTVEEYLSFLEAHPNALSKDTAESTRRRILNYGLYMSLDRYIDFAAGEAHLDSAEFQEVLERILSLPVVPSSRTDVEKLQDGEVALIDVYGIRSCRDFADLEMMSGGELVIIGYPTSGREHPMHPGGVMLGVDNTVAISALSRNKDAAFLLVEQTLSDSNAKTTSGFPTGKAAFEENLMLETGEDFEEFYKDGYLYRAITREQADQVRNACVTATVFSRQESEILSIILEECDSFFQGSKSAGEVCEIIQSRVGILLSE